MRNKLIPVNSPGEILPVYRDTPVGLLLEYHNLNRSFESYDKLKNHECFDFTIRSFV